ncbi:phage portal protein [Eubacterium sp. AF15-50]|uniref:phage portal protein n=1 Tax=unclassified Eubacterium (in: firmicutes) TaxID=2624479 RepID=UPI000E499600|nr:MULTISPECIES: phage portal protein [unclassified Eubacterium (in: firmicutes)]RHR72621.1 phage portal protein [Eubacterium sp. AF16-48]RHR75693.1 phage portal protein [Eubacterium sp. AF15-50]
MRFSNMVSQIGKVLNKNSQTPVDLSYLTAMAGYIELWSAMYEGKSPWLKKNDENCNLPASIAQEIARLVTLELKSECTGSERADYIEKYYAKALESLKKYVEYGCAKGSLIFKPYVTANGLAVQYIQADCFFPISFDDSGNITDCIFTEQFRKNKKIYTRLERDIIEDDTLTIENMAFVSSNPEILGTQVEITAVDKWKMLENEVKFKNVSKLPFGFFKVPLANTVDSTSPIGVSVYSKAIDSIKLADERYSQIDWEFVSKETAIHIAESLLKLNKSTGKFEYPGGKDRLYREVEYSSGATDKPLLDVYSPDIRDQSFYNGFNNQLKRVEFDCNLAYGTLSDPNNVDKTAEEIKTSKQRSYSMVSDTQLALQNALNGLIVAMDFWVSIYGLAPEGKINTSFEWDDSIVVDSEKARSTDRADVAMGAMSLVEYRMKWYGETEEVAKQKIAGQQEGTTGDDE